MEAEQVFSSTMESGIEGENSPVPYFPPEEDTQEIHIRTQPWTLRAGHLRNNLNFMNLDILSCFGFYQQESILGGWTACTQDWQTNTYQQYIVLRNNVSDVHVAPVMTVTRAKKNVCRYSNCVNRWTGKQSSFKRSDHLKRHEATVHKMPGSPVHRCWVAGCKRPFSRKDNLRAHLRTHLGKPGSRNRYVASLDPRSSVYDPWWEGELDDSGFPVFGSRGLEMKGI